jgi:hypothetical protein
MKKLNVPSGNNEFKFSASGLASGVYFYRIKVKDASSQVLESKVNKMIVLK